MTKRLTSEDLKKKSEIPSQNALKMHPFYRGKLQVMPRHILNDFVE